MKKTFIKIFFLILSSCLLYGESYGPKQLIPAGHWIYDALYTIYTEASRAVIADSAPLSVEEIQFHLEQIDSESLSPSGKQLYGKTLDFLAEKKFSISLHPFSFSFNIHGSPQIMGKTNPDLDWSFATDYTGRKLGKSEDPGSSVTEYGAAAGFSGNTFTEPLIKFPLYFNFADFLMIEADPFFGKSFWAMSVDDNISNLPLHGSELDFLWPTNAYANTGWIFSKGWAFNLHVGKEGYQLGHSKTGSVIYNNTFQTDAYFHMGLTSPVFKYEMVVTEVDHSKYFYMHDIDVVLFKRVKLGIVEGTLVNNPFEFRYLNPLMIMHSFGSWEEYSDAQEQKYYGESHVCAYLGIKLDVIPCSNVRLYALYSQNEIQPANEPGDASTKCYPDSLGIQVGGEYTRPGKNGVYYTFNVEGIYTTPFLYIKQGADWSLYRNRSNMQSNKENPICSWMGTPFGPDCVGAQISFEYKMPLKYSFFTSYLFVAHGTNSFGLFNSEKEIDGRYYNDYYPSVLYRMHENGKGGLEWNDARSLGRSYELYGIVQFTNALAVRGEYVLNEHITLNGQVIYSFVFNNKNQLDSFAQGAEFELGAKLSLF